LHPKGSGASGSPIVIGSYGDASAAKPKINGAGVANGAVYLNNQEYWEITNLDITNFDGSVESHNTIADWESYNDSYYAQATTERDQVVRSVSAKIGVYITANDIGSVDHIYLKNLEVHAVNGAINQADQVSKNNGGIFFNITGGSTKTHFNDVLVDHCFIHDVDRTGLVTASEWDDRSLTSDGSWSPSTNFVITNNTFQRSGANALLLRVAAGPLIEHNLFDHCAIKASGNAAFNFNTDDCKWQFNEFRYTVANNDDDDAGGVDADFNTKRTIIQYNWIHNNDYGSLITGGQNSTNFNEGTQFKYNIIEKDGLVSAPGTKGKYALKISGHANNTVVYNNTIDIGPSQSSTKVFFHYKWGYYPTNSSYYNNIIDNSGTGSFYDLNGTSVTFDNNAYYKNQASGQPGQTHNITGDVKFVNPGAGDPNGYYLKVGSVAFNAGRLIPNNGGRDYFGNSVSLSAPSSIGAYNGPLQ
jgi:hypothetical protein